MSKAKITAITSAATGFPKENLLDYNPDTYWKPTTTEDQTIDIDLGAVQTVDQFAVWIHNYNTDYESGSQAISLSYSTDDSSDYSGSPAVTAFVGAFFDNTVGQPIYFPGNIAGSVSKRYWRFVIGNMTTVAEISQIFFLRTRAISIGNQFPEPDALKYHDNLIELPGGRSFVAGINSQGIYNNIARTYLLEGTTWTSTTLYLAYQDCKGRRYPLILNEGTDYKYVRFNQPDNELSKNQIEYLFYNPTVTYKQIPYIADGEYY